MSMLMEISDPQPISYSLLLLPLQSPPPAMSSSAALFFPRSEVSSVAAAGAAGSRQHADLYAVERRCERDEFAFLESKPSLMDERSAKGQGKAAKGRRHAGEAVLRRKLANQAFLVKIGGGGAAGCGAGKESGGSSKSGGGNGRRRGRVLSELVADQFAPSVPYSLNRKSRWARDGAGWLSDLVDGWSGQQRLRLCLSEADYSLAGTESVRALHRLDTSGGRLQSRWAKSGRGALLADLLAKSEEEAAEQENEEPTEEMHFQLSRPHMVSRVFAGKFFKRKQAVRCNKRAPIEMISSGPASGPALPRPTASVTESEPEEENEFMAQYRPRRETYSLADFVKDAPPTPPVMVRRPAATSGRHAAAGRAESFEHFAFVPELECMAMPEEGEEEADEENSANASDSRPCPILCGLHQRLNSTTADCGFFRRFPGQGGDQTQLQALAAARPEWHPQWLGQQLLGLDLSWALTADGGSGRQQEPDSQMLLLVIDADELLVNSLIPLDGQKVAASLEANGLEQKVDVLLAAIRSDFAEWTLANQQKRQQREAAQLEPLRSIYHSGRLALGLQPLSIHSLLAQQRAELGQEEGQFVSGEELLKQEQKPAEDEGHVEEEAEEEEEFELIDMGELLLQPNGGGCSPSSAAQGSPKMSAPKCADCSTSTAPLAMLRSCGHRLCRQCLGRALGRQMTAQETAATLRCPVCPTQVPLDLLPWLVALPVANTLVLLHHAQQQQQQQKSQADKQQFGQCPGCLGLLQCPTTGGPEFGQLCCLRCSLHWCPGCGLAPHWPLDCAQNAEWARRSRPAEEADADQPSQQKSVKCQQVSGQFAEVCAEARTRRLDARLGWQLGKHMRRLGDSRAERRFGAARKTALHLLEFGTVLLYLNRQQRSPAWSQLKSLLSALRDRVECLDSELLFSGSLTDPTGLRAKLADLEQLSEKCLAKLAAANAGKMEEKMKQQQQQ